MLDNDMQVEVYVLVFSWKYYAFAIERNHIETSLDTSVIWTLGTKSPSNWKHDAPDHYTKGQLTKINYFQL